MSTSAPSLVGLLQTRDGIRPSASTGRSSFDGPPDAFSRTLQSRLDNEGAGSQRAPAPEARRESADRPRTAERAPDRPAAEPARRTEPPPERAERPDEKASDGTATSAETTSERRQPGKAAPAGKAADAERRAAAGPSPDGDAASTASGAAVPPGMADAVASALGDELATSDTDEAGTEPATLADLPAALAALLAAPGQRTTTTPAGDTDAALAAAGLPKAPTQQGSALSGGAAEDSGRSAKELSALFTEGSSKGDSASAAALLSGRAAAGQGSERLAAAQDGAANPLLPAGAQAAEAGAQGVNVFAALRHAATTNQPATPQLPVHTPASQQAWAEDVGKQVHWMLGRAESKAELVLTPQSLGKLEVSINLNGDQTTAQFVAATQAARDALEQALPRLREILQQAGINLGQTSVSTSGDQGARGEGGSQGGRGGKGGGAEPGGTVAGGTGNWSRRHDGMVDTFV